MSALVHPRVGHGQDVLLRRVLRERGDGEGDEVGVVHAARPLARPRGGGGHAGGAVCAAEGVGPRPLRADRGPAPLAGLLRRRPRRLLGPAAGQGQGQVHTVVQAALLLRRDHEPRGAVELHAQRLRLAPAQGVVRARGPDHVLRPRLGAAQRAQVGAGAARPHRAPARVRSEGQHARQPLRGTRLRRGRGGGCSARTGPTGLGRGTAGQTRQRGARARALLAGRRRHRLGAVLHVVRLLLLQRAVVVGHPDHEALAGLAWRRGCRGGVGRVGEAGCRCRGHRAGAICWGTRAPCRRR